MSELRSKCCGAKVKMNPIEWSSPYHVKTWQLWCLKCGKPIEVEEKAEEEKR